MPALIGIGLLALFLLFPLVAMAVVSLRTHQGLGLDAWVSLLTKTRNILIIRETVMLVAERVVIAIPLAGVIAWVLARKKLPYAGWIELGFWASLFIPTMTITIAWIALFGGSSGLINRLLMAYLPFSTPPINIYSQWGIVFTHLTSGTIAFAVVLLIPAFRSIDSSLEEASIAAGASPFRTFTNVVVPTIAPALTAVLLLSVVKAFDSLEIEWVLGPRAGIDILSTVAYRDVINGGGFSAGSTTGTLLMLVVLPFAALQRFAKPHKPLQSTAIRTALGNRLKPAMTLVLGTLALLTVIPLTISLGVSLGMFAGNGLSISAFANSFTDSNVSTAMENTFSLAVGTSFLSVAIFTVLAYIISRSKGRDRRPLEFLSSVPTFVPGIVLALGIVVVLAEIPQARNIMSNRAAPVVLVALLTTLPIGLQIMRSALDSLSDIEDASLAAGGGLSSTIRYIVLPLAAPAVLFVGLLTFAMAVRLTGPAAIVAGSSFRPLSVVQMEMMAKGGAVPEAAVMGLGLAIVSVGVAVGARLLAVGIRSIDEEGSAK